MDFHKGSTKGKKKERKKEKERKRKATHQSCANWQPLRQAVFCRNAIVFRFRLVHGTSTLPRNRRNSEAVEQSALKICSSSMSSVWWTTEHAIFATMMHTICSPMNVAASVHACSSRCRYITDVLAEATTNHMSVRLFSQATVMREVNALIISYHSTLATAHCHVCPAYL